MTISTAAGNQLSGGLSEATWIYLRHVEGGIPLRQIARAHGCHASTVLRWVRRVEERREDPLIDEALTRLGTAQLRPTTALLQDIAGMSAPIRKPLRQAPAEQELENYRILRRLAETGAVLVVGAGQDKAVILRATVRTAVTARETAQDMALRDWIRLRHTGRVTSYDISAMGRAALRRHIAQERAALGESCGEGSCDGCDDGVDEGAQNHNGPGTDTAFADQHRDYGPDRGARGGGKRARVNLAESPLGVLARRRDAQGKPFLSADLVLAGERLREDFELAQMGPRITQNWERFLTAGDRGAFNPETARPATGGGPERARERVALALRDLGPGLADMVLRCCCFLEGLEAAERRFGWSARSGKIVLRIALMRLKRHYDETYGGKIPLIG